MEHGKKTGPDSQFLVSCSPHHETQKSRSTATATFQLQQPATISGISVPPIQSPLNARKATAEHLCSALIQRLNQIVHSVATTNTKSRQRVSQAQLILESGHTHEALQWVVSIYLCSKNYHLSSFAHMFRGTKRGVNSTMMSPNLLLEYPQLLPLT